MFKKMFGFIFFLSTFIFAGYSFAGTINYSCVYGSVDNYCYNGFGVHSFLLDDDEYETSDFIITDGSGVELIFVGTYGGKVISQSLQEDDVIKIDYSNVSYSSTGAIFENLNVYKNQTSIYSTGNLGIEGIDFINLVGATKSFVKVDRQTNFLKVFSDTASYSIGGSGYLLSTPAGQIIIFILSIVIIYIIYIYIRKFSGFSD